MKKIFYTFLTLTFTVLFFGNGNAQSFDAKLSLILYDSFPGYPNSTPYNDSYAGRYRVTVPNNNTNIRVTHSIPTVLSDGNGHTIPFSIASNNASYRLSGNLNVNGSTIFNPNNPFVVNTAGSNSVTFWLGGTVSPPTNAFPSNDYS